MHCLRMVNMMVKSYIAATEIWDLELTNKIAMTQLYKGRLSIFSCFGREYIMYNSIMNPGASIVAHPMGPGRL